MKTKRKFPGGSYAELRLKWLKKNFPSKHIVNIYIKPKEGIPEQGDGYTRETEKAFSVFINSKLEDLMQAEVLMHEWAHVRVQHIETPSNQTDEHHSLWQLEFGRISAEWERYKEQHA